ncbi:MAG: large conductance mechanosensitive channel protein MscL [Phototrophicaceae bacterium]
MLQEFREFAMRGNVLDLAIGIILGSAFGAIVASLVADIIMPPIGMLLGGVDFSSLFIDLSGEGYPSLVAAQEAGAPTINYGLFINTIINFLVVAFSIFMMVKGINSLQREEEVAEEESEPDTQERLIEAIDRLNDTIKNNS